MSRNFPSARAFLGAATSIASAASTLSAWSAAHAAEPARPFPQHAKYAPGVILPSQATSGQMDAAVAAFYTAWKARYLREDGPRGQAYIFYNREGTAAAKGAISVSEGHGYGMILTALFAGRDPDAQRAFDALHAWFRAHPSRLTPGLMSWQQWKGGKDRKGDDDSASDGDLDIAYALLLADRQWGSDGAVNYREEARRVLNAVLQGDVNPNVPLIKLGDWVAADAAQRNDMRLSDFIPDHFRVFARETSDSVWDGLVDAGHRAVDFLQTCHAPRTGLLPDFACGLDSGAPSPAKPRYLEAKTDGEYSYNACRAPWRIGLDYLLFGDARSKAAAERMTAFIKAKTGGNPAAIRAGYFLASGNPISRSDKSLAFTAPFAVAAMCDPAHQQWLDRLWAHLAATPMDEDDYYGNTIKLLCMTAISGNWWAP